MQRPPVTRIPSNPSLEGLAEMIPDVIYSSATGQDLTLTLLAPWRNGRAKPRPRNGR